MRHLYYLGEDGPMMLFVEEVQVGQFAQGGWKIYKTVLHPLERDGYKGERGIDESGVRIRFGSLWVAQAYLKEGGCLDEIC